MSYINPIQIQKQKLKTILTWVFFFFSTSLRNMYGIREGWSFLHADGFRRVEVRKLWSSCAMATPWNAASPWTVITQLPFWWKSIWFM